jgi:iron complex transport system substrate-binding protein
MKKWTVALGFAVLTLPTQAAEVTPRRIVSLIPAVTEMIFAMGGGSRLVGVSSYDRVPPEVVRVERVGGLFDPNVERILSLKPDLVVVYDTQAELKQRLNRAGIPFYAYEHRALADVMVTIRAIGARIGLPGEAAALASSMERDIQAVRTRVARLPRLRTMLVFGREPSSLRNITASGGYGFLHDMLQAAGGDNVFADILRQSVTVSTEMVLARRPDVIIELHYGESVKPPDIALELQAWDVLQSVPAIRNRRVHLLVGDEFVVPGPRLVEGIRRLAVTVHPGLAQ